MNIATHKKTKKEKVCLLIMCQPWNKGIVRTPLERVQRVDTEMQGECKSVQQLEQNIVE